MKYCKSLYLAAMLSLASSAPFTVHADGGEHAEQHQAGGHEDHGSAEHAGHHAGSLTLHEIVAGAESQQFWGAVLNFALLVVVLRWLLKKPLASFLEGRKSAIERGISEAAEAKRKAEAVHHTYSERLKTLDAELAKLRQDVAAAAERERSRIVTEANETVARLKAETQALIERQGEQLQIQIRREVVAAAAAAAEKAVREQSTPEDHVRLAEAFVRELSKVGNGKHQSPTVGVAAAFAPSAPASPAAKKSKEKRA